MSYIEAVALSAEVLDNKRFGDWQGTWYAVVRYQETIQLVHGYYGSCSGCDAFQHEFGYRREGCEEHSWDPQ